MKILIADDNHFYRCTLQATLTEWGYETQAVKDGKEAWEVLSRPEAPRMAILDWVMPGLDGAEVCRRVRTLKREEPTYLILLTARDGMENIITGLESGADDYMSKPFNREELRARLQVGMRIVGLQESLAARVTELEQALSGAQKLEAVGRLAGGVAHDFNNLLTVINGYGNLAMQRLPQGDPVRGMVQQMTRAGERGAALTRQLLAFSRKQVLRPTVLELNGLVAGVEKMLLRLIGEDIELETRLAPNLYPVQGDAGQLEQVLMNLVVNSRDAMPNGGRIIIETRNVELGEKEGSRGCWPARPGPHVLLSVRDTGCGMDEDTKRHIFEPFFTTKEVGKGTGLGLATVYGIVRQSNGHIVVESAPGQGAEFQIYLPRAVERLEPAQPRPASVRVRPGSETVLLVEDEDAVRSLACQVLQSNNYIVLEACDGEKALQTAGAWTEPIHLLLTDVVMPRLGGAQLADRLMPQHPGLKVLYLSGYPDVTIRSRPATDSEDHFLQKPFTPAALTQKVREVLDR
jgi:signal transduction histidine kinase